MAAAMVSYGRAGLRDTRAAMSQGQAPALDAHHSPLARRASDGGLRTYGGILFGPQDGVVAVYLISEQCVFLFLVLDETRFVLTLVVQKAQEDMCLGIMFGLFQII
jgi:hypothetical protein